MNMRNLTDLKSISKESKPCQELHTEAEELLARYRALIGLNGSASSSEAAADSEARSNGESAARTQEDSSAKQDSSAQIFSASLEALLLSLRPAYQDSDYLASKSRSDNGPIMLQQNDALFEEDGASTEAEQQVEIESQDVAQAQRDDPILDGIPYSSSEDLPKLELAPDLRLCSTCGNETDIYDDRCQNCGGVDRSLGILEAVIAGDLDRVEQLLSAKPLIIRTHTSGHKWTLLHMAASGGNSKLAKLLISRGADINARTTDEITALHYAAGKGHAKVVRTLLEHGADATFTSGGKTALDLAEESGRDNVVKLLRGPGVNA